jgi:hypothetical protein
MSAPARRDNHDQTVIPLADAPSLAELAQRARAHEPITLVEAGAPPVVLLSTQDHQAAVDWDAAFIADTLASGGPRGPYLPNDLLAAMDTADLATVEAFLDRLAAHAGQDISAAQQRALWEQMTTQ